MVFVLFFHTLFLSFVVNTRVSIFCSASNIIYYFNTIVPKSVTEIYRLETIIVQLLVYNICYVDNVIQQKTNKICKLAIDKHLLL